MKIILENSETLVVETTKDIIPQHTRFTTAHPIVAHWPEMLRRDDDPQTITRMPTEHRAFAEKLLAYFRENPSGVVEVSHGAE